MPEKWFTCAACKGRFPQHPEQTEEDRSEERQRLWGGPPAPDDLRVCDDCFKRLLAALEG